MHNAFPSFSSSGYIVLSHYTIKFLHDAGIDFNPSGGAIVVSLVRLAAAPLTSILMCVMRKKHLYVGTLVVGTTCMLTSKYTYEHVRVEKSIIIRICKELSSSLILRLNLNPNSFSRNPDASYWYEHLHSLLDSHHWMCDN